MVIPALGQVAIHQPMRQGRPVLKPLHLTTAQVMGGSDAELFVVLVV